MSLYLSHYEMFPALVHGFSSCAEGNMSFKYGEAEEVAGRRQSFLESLGIPSDSCTVISALHGSKIRHVASRDQGSGLDDDLRPECDALMTNERGVYLLLLVADCLPIICYDPVQSVVALAHCGWKGTNEKLAGKVVEEMAARYGSAASDLIVGIGPGIHRESYVVQNPAQKQSPEWEDFLTDLPDGRTAIDIVGYNLRQLLAAGVRETNVQVSNVDTARSDEVFSHYRSTRTGEPEGRFCAAVGMRREA